MPDTISRAEQSERTLGRVVSMGIPAAAVIAAGGVEISSGLGPALLVMAGGAFLGTITLLWTSLRTLTGEAPLPDSLSSVHASAKNDGTAQRKRSALRALKDLEFEHSIGKIDDEDYADLLVRYRDQAKAVLREIDVAIDPLRIRAEDIARQYLEKRGLERTAPPIGAPADDDRTAVEDAPVRLESSVAATRRASRVACVRCAASNEADAIFCKGCGGPLGKVCSVCETKNEADAGFCKKCGTSMSSEVPDVSA